MKTTIVRNPEVSDRFTLSFKDIPSGKIFAIQNALIHYGKISEVAKNLLPELENAITTIPPFE